MKLHCPDREETSWSWEGAHVTRLLESATWPMSKKLAWLESAGELAGKISRGRQKLIDKQPRKKSS